MTTWALSIASSGPVIHSRSATRHLTLPHGLAEIDHTDVGGQVTRELLHTLTGHIGAVWGCAYQPRTAGSSPPPDEDAPRDGTHHAVARRNLRPLLPISRVHS